MRLLILTLAIFMMFLVGCSSSGGKGSYTTLQGKVVDGYVQNATVFIDFNNNTTLDSNEPRATTDETGSYTLVVSNDALGANTPIVAIGGNEKETNAPFKAYAKNFTHNKDAQGNLNLSGITTLVVERYGFLQEQNKTDNFANVVNFTGGFLNINPQDQNSDIFVNHGTNYENLKANLKIYQYLESVLGNTQNVATSKEVFKEIAKMADTHQNIDSLVSGAAFYGVLISSKQVQINENQPINSDLFEVVHPQDGILSSSAKLLKDHGTIFGGSLDFETSPQKNLTLVVGNKEYAVQLEVKDINEASTNLRLSFNWVNENMPIGTTVGSFLYDDQDSIHAHQLTIEANNGFYLEGNLLKTKRVFDKESLASMNVVLHIVDNDFDIFSTFAISINDLNEAPQIEDKNFSVDEDNILNGNISVVFGDPEGDSYSFRKIESSSNAMVNLNTNGAFTYTPIANYFGEDFFSYEVCDTHNLCTEPKKVFVNVRSINDAPTIANNISISLNEDASNATYTLNGEDVENNPLSYSLIATPTKLNATLGTNGLISYTPNLNANGLDVLSYKVCDSLGACSGMKTISFTINPINDSPTAISLSANNIAENSSQGTIIGNLSTTDVDSGDSFIYSIVSIDNNPNNNIFGVSGSNLIVGSIALDYETKQSYSVVIRSSDSGGLSLEQTFNVNILNISDAPPVLANSTISIDDTQSNKIIGSVSVVSVDGANIANYAITANPNNINASVDASGNISITNAMSAGIYILKIQATNANGQSNEAQITINVSATPIPTLDETSVSIAENLSGEHHIGNVNVLDNGGGIVAYSIDDTSGLFSVHNDGKIYTTPSASFDFEGQSTYTFHVTATNNIPNTSAAVTVTIHITNINEAPFFANALSSVTIDEGTTYVTNLEATDPDGDALTYVIVDEPLHGSVVLNNLTGALSFSPATHYYGSDSFSYKALDATLQTPIHQVNITINNINDAPEFNSNNPTTLNLTEDEPFVVDFIVQDFENDSMNVTIVDNPSNYPFSITKIDNNTWRLIGTPLDAHVGASTLSLRVSDTALASNDLVVAVSVANVNDAPFATNPSIVVPLGIGKTIEFPILGINDGDANIDQNVALVNVASSNTNYATVGANDTNGSDGNISLNLTGLLAGTTTISYTISDGITSVQYSFDVKVQADSGYVAYRSGSVSGYPVVQLATNLGGTISYTWNSTHKWYEGIDPDTFEQIILLPVQATSQAIEDLAIGSNTNVQKPKLGHYYVKKNDYIDAARSSQTTQRTTSTTYTTAGGTLKTASDNNFQHVGFHHMFVSRVYLNSNGVGYETKTYTNWTAQSTNFITAPTTQNENYATKKSTSTYYVGTATVDTKNNGLSPNFCAIRYGEGWRLPTIYESGVSSPTAGFKGFFPAFMGNSGTELWLSSSYNSSNFWTIQPSSGGLDYWSSSASKSIRCIFLSE